MVFLHLGCGGGGRKAVAHRGTRQLLSPDRTNPKRTVRQTQRIRCEGPVRAGRNLTACLTAFILWAKQRRGSPCGMSDGVGPLGERDGPSMQQCCIPFVAKPRQACGNERQIWALLLTAGAPMLPWLLPIACLVALAPRRWWEAATVGSKGGGLQETRAQGLMPGRCQGFAGVE